MNGAVLLGISVVLFVTAYLIYGRFLSRLFGVDPARATPAHTKGDGIDYIPTRPAILFGHHFASIAGAGPIVGPIAAAYYGWGAVVLWVVVGCIFIGAMHDFSALFLSVRNEGRSVGYIIEKHVGYAGRQIFLLFSWSALILVVAVFSALVAKTFVVSPEVATASLLFVAIAPVFGWLVYRKGMPLAAASAVFVPVMFALIWVGMKFPLDLGGVLGICGGEAQILWIIVLLIYAFVASVLPVWLLLQPRDYLNSYLLYAMIILGFIGIFVKAPAIAVPAFTGWSITKGATVMPLFPILFVTVACGACSGFHALVASGTTAKQLDNEKHILPVSYGAMLVEGVLAVMALISVAYLSGDAMARTIASEGAVNAFSDGLAVFSDKITAGIGMPPGAAKVFFSLAISAFLLTTLDTATRLTRFTWQELFTARGGVESERSGAFRRVFSDRFVATLIVVCFSAYLAFSGRADQIWPVFGASNQLLAALTLLVITLILIRGGKRFVFTLLPMIFMMIICVWALLSLLAENFRLKNWSLTCATSFLLLMAFVLILQSMLSLRGAGKEQG